jgi:hypothetical protein
MNLLQKQTSITNRIFSTNNTPETRRTSTLLIGGVTVGGSIGIGGGIKVGGEAGISRSRLTTGSKLICSALMVAKENQ